MAPRVRSQAVSEAGLTPPNSVASPRPPNGVPLQIRRPRPRPPADPLVRPKKRLPPRKPGDRPLPVKIEEAPTPPPVEEDNPDDYHEYKLVTTKASLKTNMRYYCMKLHSKKDINLMDPEAFTRPVRLHRRDPRAPLQGAGKMEAIVGSGPETDEKDIDLVEKAKLEAAAAEKEALQKENLARIAPHGGAVKQKKNMFKKKTQQVFQKDEEQQKLRYEEFMPWMIEDFDNKNTWSGQMEGALSKSSVMLVLDEGNFKMIPIEKFYRFQQRNLYKSLTSEEAEAQMKKQERLGRWFMKLTKEEENAAAKQEYETNMKSQKKLFTVKGDRLEGREAKAGFAEADELDFEEDFADDEEAPIIEGDEEDLKETTKKLKREQLSANVFDVRDEKEYEKEEREKKMLERARKAHGKKVKKALKNREKNFAYDDSDSDANPYASSAESVDTEEEEERKKEEEEKKKAVEKAAKEKEETKLKEKEAKDAAKLDKSFKAAGGPASGAATPQPQSGTSPAALSIDNNKSKSLKRPGSPGAESGNESSHQQKRLKKSAVAQENGAASIGKPTSTAAAKVNGPKRKKLHGGNAGSASEYETGGEMSDGAGSDVGRVKKQKLNATAKTSRAGSPSTVIPGKSRSASPERSGKPSRSVSPSAGKKQSKKSKPAPEKVTEEEMRATFESAGEKGYSMRDFAQLYKPRIDSDNKDEFFTTLKRITKTVEVAGRGKVFLLKTEADFAAEETAAAEKLAVDKGNNTSA